MQLDMVTLVAVTSMTSLVAALSIGMLWLVHGRYPGIGFWAAGAFGIAAGGLLIAARNALPEAMSLIGGNVALIGGVALVLRGVNTFTRQPHQTLLEVGTVATVALGQGFLILIQAALSIRFGLLCLCWVALYAAMAQRFFAYGRREAAMALISRLGGVVATGHTLFVAAVGLLTVALAPPQGPLERHPLRIATYFEGNLVILMLTLCLVLLVTRRLEVDLGRLATTDELTGCLTRRAFLTECGREMARVERNGGSCAVIMFDADHFKAINDQHGHHVGDLVLAEIARRVTACLRPQDRLGRHGGEEFCVLLTDAGPDQAAGVAERLRQAVAEPPVRAGDEQIAVTISLGVAAVPGHAADMTGLLRAADDALYRAKRGGRNRSEIALPAAA